MRVKVHPGSISRRQFADVPLTPASTVESVFGSGGLMARRFASYEPREGQVKMAAAIEEAIAKGGHVLADAPTATGKSLAYLVPAIASAVARSEKVIVVTANIALQEQLVHVDLPRLRELLPEEFSFALMKGKNNYLCVSKLEKELGESLLNRDPAIQKAFDWAQETQTGDQSELEDGIAPAAWRKLSVASDECKGQQCRYFERCFAEIARRKAQNAEVVVTNYHLFFAHLVVRAKMRARNIPGVSPDVILPPCTTLIFDEAHKAADIARDFLGFSVTPGTVEWVAKGVQHELARDVDKAAAAFFADLTALKRDKRYQARIRPGQEVKSGDHLSERIGELGMFYAAAADGAAFSSDERAELQMRASRCANLASQVGEFANLANGSAVYFVEENERGVPAARMKPIDVAPFLRTELFGQYKTVVMTSATLATSKSRGGFEFVKKDIGCDFANEVMCESPFDWATQAIVVVPRGMPDPGDRDAYTAAVATKVREACELADGRTLALFTSYKNLNAAEQALRGFKHRVLTQKDGPKTKIVGRFKEDTHSVLLGAESFWAGVDCPGETLSCVTIDRLPFPTPDDPIASAMQERDRNWFFTYAVPRAVIQIRQAFGRGVRTRADRAAVVIMDPRCLSKGYGKSILHSLPTGVRLSQDMDAVGKFLAALGAS